MVLVPNVKKKPNEPCFCGSKRKYKKCCMGKIGRDDEAYRRRMEELFDTFMGYQNENDPIWEPLCFAYRTTEKNIHLFPGAPLGVWFVTNYDDGPPEDIEIFGPYVDLTEACWAGDKIFGAPHWRPYPDEVLEEE